MTGTEPVISEPNPTFASTPLLVCTSTSIRIKLPQHGIRTNRHLSTLPKNNTLPDKHTNLLILQRAHPAAPERLMPVPNLRPSILIQVLLVADLPRHRPLALESAHEKA
jgi:hypothetical protein